MSQTRTSRAPIAAAAVVAVVLFAGGVLALGGQALKSTTTTTRSIPAARVMDVETTSGDLEVVAAAGRGARLTTRESGSFARPHVRVSEQDGRLRLRDGCSDVPFSGCRASFRLEVPAGTRLRLTAGSGDVRTRAITGRVDARTGSGDVVVLAAAGPLALQSGSGDVHAETRGATVEGRSGSGDVEVRAPRARRMLLRSGSGDVSVLAGGGPYAVHTRTGSGDEHVTVATDPGAPRSIDAQTGSGDVRIAPVS